MSLNENLGNHKSGRLLWGIIFTAIGIISIILLSFSFSKSIYPFFSTAIYVDSVIILISLLLIIFFYFYPLKKRDYVVFFGFTFIILGELIIIFSLFGIVSFHLYYENLESESSIPFSVFKLDFIFVPFIVIGIGLIIHGIFLIKKRNF
jgi:hypothetical protein